MMFNQQNRVARRRFTRVYKTKDDPGEGDRFQLANTAKKTQQRNGQNPPAFFLLLVLEVVALICDEYGAAPSHSCA